VAGHPPFAAAEAIPLPDDSVEEDVAFELGFGPARPQRFGVARKPAA